MQTDEQKKVREIVQSQAKLKKISIKTRNLKIQLAAAKKSLEELEQTEEKTVFHIIDSLLIPRERQIVIKEIKEKTELISNQLESLKKEWEQEFTRLKQLNIMSTVDDVFG